MKKKGFSSSKMLGMKVLPFYLFTFLLFSLSGCIEEYEADIASDDTDLLVVEGAICSSQLNKFILSRSQPISAALISHLSPQSSIPIVKGAKVSVRGSDGSEYTAEEADGYYSCMIGDLDPNEEYYLRIETDGEVYESEPQKPICTEGIAEVIGEQYTPTSNIEVLITPDVPSVPNQTIYYSWRYEETWEVHPDYTTIIFFDTKFGIPVYDPHQFPECGWKNATGPTIMVGSSQSYEGQHIQKLKLYEIDRGSERMYVKYSGLIHQRTISKAEYEYELARRQAGSEMGGLFTPLPSALPTNIHCLTSEKHVIGFVGCSLNTSEYRFFLEPTDYSIDRPVPKDSRRWLDDCTEGDCYRMVMEEHMFLCEWDDQRYRPDGVLRTAWAYDYQLDVRLRGAYVEKPDFWK